MSKFIFDEQKNDEKIINSCKFDGISIQSMIKKLAKYNFYVKNMDDFKNREAIIGYMQQHSYGFATVDWDETIENAIKNCKKYQYKKVDSIKITKQELDFIGLFNDIKKEKVLFVMLCLAKYNHYYNKSNNFWVNSSASLIFKEARVHIKSVERLGFLRELYLAGAYDLVNGTGSASKRITFVSECSDDDVVLELGENDFEELAYTYLFYKDGFSGYIHCEKCGKLTKQKSNRQKFCAVCAKESKKASTKESDLRRYEKIRKLGIC